MTERIISIYRGSELVLTRVKLVQSLWQHLWGLMFHKDFPGVDGLLVYPCKFVCMLGMRFAVDLVYLDRSKKVLYTIDVLVPNKFGPFIVDAYYIIEMPAGIVAAKNIKIGEQMQW